MCEFCDREHRPLYEIARDIRMNWPKVNYAAKPYLDAMGTIECPEENYGYDTGSSIVLYFLANAQTWRGEDARRIKAELNKLA